jgi:hypothetical protein
VKIGAEEKESQELFNDADRIVFLNFGVRTVGSVVEIELYIEQHP